MQFPFKGHPGTIQPGDLQRFGVLFSQVVKKVLPCEEVVFEQVEPEPPSSPEAVFQEPAWEGQPLIDPAGPVLYLPLAEGKTPLGVAVIKGGEPELYTNCSQEWLLERGRLITQEIRLIRQWGTDSVTGLLSGDAFREQLKIELETQTDRATRVSHLVLFEIYPWARNAEQGLRSITKIASQLDSLIGGIAPLCHFGSGVFAQLWHQAEEEQLLKMGNAVLRWLKRENVVRGHIGVAGLQSEPEEEGHPDWPGRLVATGIDQAWQALGVARRRGPHALCTFASLQRQDHPLRKPPQDVLSELKKAWRGKERFALILLHQDQSPVTESFPRRVCSLVGAGNLILPLSPREAYVFLPGADQEQAGRWRERFRRRLQAMEAVTYSMGIALFPLAGFHKKDMALNARKALLHTRFFGQDTAAVFDSVSLNISGDSFYEEGDLAKAIKEYRQGLALDSGNVNLLNSLGVAYAQMNRYQKAIPLFEQGLAIEPQNFMALFNLGYAYLAQAETAQAIRCFERALARDAQHFDLLLQLGKLYCETGRYEKAVTLLARAEQLETGGRSEVGQGRVYLCLGQAQAGLGNRQQAIINLQRAVQYNPRDGNALSLLGELYALENQGTDIALSMCRQAIEIDDSRWEYWYRLGRVQHQQGDLSAAVSALQQSLRLSRKNLQVLEMLGRIFEHQGKLAQARKIQERILRLDPDQRRALDALGRLKRQAA